jgi:putative inorganic carbon (hco3(-)) transporter
MRDIVFIAIIIAACGVALVHPWIGILAWTWISVMNPHAYTWAAANMPVAAFVAGTTLVGMVVTRDRIQLFATRETITLMLFMSWVTISLLFAFNTDASFDMWSKVMKIDFMILVTLAVLYTKRHIMLFVGVVVFSLAFYGIKGGVFTIATGGDYKVFGPGGFIGGNNEMALALVVVIPLMRFLQLQTANLWLRHGLTLGMALTAASALGSHSRGALLAIVAMAVFFWLRSNQKLLVGLVIVCVGAGLLAFLPHEWMARMETIGEYEQDASAMGRINAWWMAFNLAKDRFTGGGFETYEPEIFAIYAPNPKLFLAAHSIYFQVLGEHGFPGLAIYLILWWFVWRTAGELARHRERMKETAWCRDLGAMAQASLVGYAVGGAFLSLAYFDLPYDIMVMVVLTRRWIARRAWEEESGDRHAEATAAQLTRT